MQGTVALTPGATLNMRVGGKGGDGQVFIGATNPTVAGGFNGGGTNTFTCTNCSTTLGATGGGSSDVRTSTDGLADRLLVAGGGGGAGSGGLGDTLDPGTGGDSASAAKSVTGVAGVTTFTCSGGGAGTLLGPGAPGSLGGSVCLSGQAGAAGTGGGNGGLAGIGAGGGGYFGGGAGARAPNTASGGGGGSDYPDPLSPPVGISGVTVTDGVQSGNGLITVTYATPTADLALAKTVSDATPNVGDLITFTVTLSNPGPDPATNVAVNDLLPAGLTFVSATPSQGTYNAATGLWTVGTVPRRHAATLTLAAKVDSARPADQHRDDQPQRPVRPGHGQQQRQRHRDAATGRPRAHQDGQRPDAERRRHDHLHRHADQQRPRRRDHVTVTDLLPAGLTFVSATPSQGTYDAATGAVDRRHRHPGRRNPDHRGEGDRPTAQTNTATISHSDQFDPDTGNNSASATETPQPPTAVTFASAGATRTARGVLVRWRTGTEADLLGFQVYRSRGHSWKRLTRSLIPAKGSVSGASYRFLDRTARRGVGYRYRIKALNRDGTTSWFGPVRVT